MGLNQLRGCGTAIVTPFARDERIDEAALRRLVEFQIEGGVDFIVACGTTGESVTMTAEENARVVEIAIDAAAGRASVVAGAGGYNTREVIERIERFAELGADAILSVTPYYNKPTQEGLYQHYRAINDASALPLILYNVPGRTGCNMEPSTVARLAELERISAIKEASGNITQIAEIASLVDDSFGIFAGDDTVVLPVAALGGVGVISVASNLLPDRVSALTHACIEGRFDEARRLNAALIPVFKALFIESNPIPVKAALAMTGMCEEVYRLPLVPMSEANRTRLRGVLVEAGVAVEAALPANA
ncbi:MAG: 4-hydroxy-tetrahydrodipicolinate synthase [Acidobacteria bacterium]|nr:4-hydroxy-tetrahydrodipicolinate synthase [Acidobacteriota bacterium]MCW5970468.1 4-hydroxy-tetrahydrodipicolinate synthase [Blastocatellales bacterium]